MMRTLKAVLATSALVLPSDHALPSSHSRTQPIFTPVWQGGVAGIGVLVLLLLTKAQVKLKDDRSEAKAV